MGLTLSYFIDLKLRGSDEYIKGAMDILVVNIGVMDILMMNILRGLPKSASGVGDAVSWSGHRWGVLILFGVCGRRWGSAAGVMVGPFHIFRGCVVWGGGMWEYDIKCLFGFSFLHGAFIWLPPCSLVPGFTASELVTIMIPLVIESPYCVICGDAQILKRNSLLLMDSMYYSLV